MNTQSKILAATLGAAALSALAALAYKKTRQTGPQAMPAYPETAGTYNGSGMSADRHADDAPLSVNTP